MEMVERETSTFIWHAKERGEGDFINTMSITVASQTRQRVSNKNYKLAEYKSWKNSIFQEYYYFF